MRPKPTPSKELSVDKFINHIRFTPHSNDAKSFILSEAYKYGWCIDVPDGTFSLEVSSGYNVDKVAEYFESYND